MAFRLSTSQVKIKTKKESLFDEKLMFSSCSVSPFQAEKKLLSYTTDYMLVGFSTFIRKYGLLSETGGYSW